MSPARHALSGALAALGVVGVCAGGSLSAQSTRTGAAVGESAPVAAARDARAGWARVTYLSGDLIYLDAGTVAGLREKSVVDVVRRDSIVAVLEVQFVSSSRAAARKTRGAEVMIGDSVRFVPVVDVIVSASGASPAPVDTTSSGARQVEPARRKGPRSVTGRVGLRYMWLQTGSGANGRITQPAADLRLEGHRIGGSALGLVVDARAHRQQSGSGRVNASTRVYQSLLEYQGRGRFPVNITAGRQLASVLSPLGFFDGLTIEVNGRHWRTGALGGTQPDFASFAPSAAIREVGGWVQWHNAGKASLLNATVGAVGSYAADGVNREFALLSTNYVSPTVSLYATQEVDVNRGWKRSAESGKAITPTSTFATLRVAINRAVAVNAGYDSRRSVRLYRDFLTPDVVFDDALRRGYWGGLSVSMPHVYVSADTRTSDGQTVGLNRSSTASLSVTRLPLFGVGLRARGTSYRGPTVTGTLTSASIEFNPWGRLRVEATTGRRDDQRALGGMTPARTTWVGFDADAGLGRSWYLMASSYREVGASDRMLTQYLSLSWRF